MRALWLALVCLGCSGVDADPGVDALLQVGAAQFVPGALPAEGGGPAILAVDQPLNTARPGEVAWPLGATLAPEARAVAIQLSGDRGYWLKVADAPRVDAPDQPTFTSQLSFAHRVRRNPVELTLVALDADGRAGPASIIALDLDAETRPAGALVVTLTWDRDADLDLRVVEPSGVEIFARNPSAAGDDTPGLPPTAGQLEAAGRLTLDSNARCVIDGRRREHAVWTQPPVSGRYRVRVDTPSLCAATSARWRVVVHRDDVVIASAEGVSTADDTRADHDLGAGVLALEFDL